MKSANTKLNDSFRHKNTKKNQIINSKSNNSNFNNNLKKITKSYNNKIMRKSLDDFKDEFPFAHKKNHRSSEKIKKFVKEKKNKK